MSSMSTNQRTVAMPEDLLLQMVRWVAVMLQSLEPRISLGTTDTCRDVKDLVKQLRGVQLASMDSLDSSVPDDGAKTVSSSNSDATLEEQHLPSANSNETSRQTQISDLAETGPAEATGAEEEIQLTIEEQWDQLKARMMRRCAERVVACKAEEEIYEDVLAFGAKYGDRAKAVTFGWIDMAAESAEILREFCEAEAKWRKKRIGIGIGRSRRRQHPAEKQIPAESRKEREAWERWWQDVLQDIEADRAAREAERIRLDGKSLGCCLSMNWDDIAAAESPGQEEEVSAATRERWLELKAQMLRARREAAAAGETEDAAYLATLDFAVEHGDAAWALGAEWIHRAVGAVELRERLLAREQAWQRNLAFRLRATGDLRRKIDEQQLVMGARMKALRGALVGVDRRKARLRREHQTPGPEAVRHWDARGPCGKWQGSRHDLRFRRFCGVCRLTGIERADDCPNFSQHCKWLDDKEEVYEYK